MIDQTGAKHAPTESATICSNSVSGRSGVVGCGSCEGLSGAGVTKYWSVLKPEGVLNTGFRIGDDE